MEIIIRTTETGDNNLWWVDVSKEKSLEGWLGEVGVRVAEGDLVEDVLELEGVGVLEEASAVAQVVKYCTSTPDPLAFTPDCSCPFPKPDQ